MVSSHWIRISCWHWEESCWAWATRRLVLFAKFSRMRNFRTLTSWNIFLVFVSSRNMKSLMHRFKSYEKLKNCLIFFNNLEILTVSLSSLMKNIQQLFKLSHFFKRYGKLFMFRLETSTWKIFHYVKALNWRTLLNSANKTSLRVARAQQDSTQCPQ